MQVIGPVRRRVAPRQSQRPAADACDSNAPSSGSWYRSPKSRTSTTICGPSPPRRADSRTCDAGPHREVTHGAMPGKPRVGPTAQVGDAHRRGDDDSACGVPRRQSATRTPARGYTGIRFTRAATARFPRLLRVSTPCSRVSVVNVRELTYTAVTMGARATEGAARRCPAAGRAAGRDAAAPRGPGDLRSGRARARAGQEGPRRQRRRLCHADAHPRADAGGRGAAGGARLLAFPQSGQHRRAAPSHPTPPRLPARQDGAAPDRIVRRDVRPAHRRRHRARSAARGHQPPAHRAGLHGAPHRGHPPDADAEVQTHRGPAGAARSRRPDAARARRAAQRAAHRDRRLVGDQRGPAAAPLAPR